MTESEKRDEFSKIAEDVEDQSIIREFFEFLATNKKWWLAPIVIVMLLMSALVLLTNSPVAPFIYTLF